MARESGSDGVCAVLSGGWGACVAVHRVKICGCGHEVTVHEDGGVGPCRICAKGSALGLEPCPKFHSRRHGAVAPRRAAAPASSRWDPFQRFERRVLEALHELAEDLHVEAPTVERFAHSIRPSASRRLPAPPKAKPTDGGAMAKGERIILTAIAQHAGGCSPEQLTVLTGYKRSSRDTYLKRLREKDYTRTDGYGLVATSAGRDALGPDFEPLPTGDALRRYWLGRLTGGERSIFEIVIDRPEGLPREWISAKTGYARSSRDTYLRRLRARRLVTDDHGLVRPHRCLFDGAGP